MRARRVILLPAGAERPPLFSAGGQWDAPAPGLLVGTSVRLGLGFFGCCRDFIFVGPRAVRDS